MLVVYMCGSLVSSLGRDLAIAEQHGLSPWHSHEVPRLRLVGLGTIAMMDDQSYACIDCSMIVG